MALNTSKCNHPTPLPFKGLKMTGVITIWVNRSLVRGGADDVMACRHSWRQPVMLTAQCGRLAMLIDMALLDDL